MCLAVPMKVTQVRQDGTGTVDLDGVTYEVNLRLLSDRVGPGDHVIVHAGCAIERLDQEDADQRLALFAELARMQERVGHDQKEARSS